jgi:cell division protein FtsB
VVFVLAAIVVGYFIFAAAKDTLLSHNLTGQERQLQQQIDELQAQEARLQAIRDYLNTDEYVQGVAHRLGLVRPGEKLVIVSSTAPATPTPTPGASTGHETWWEQLYGAQ